ncbi:LysM domain-containing protein [Billgrantia montanilacus]|uniref:LysM domain-containing protein n=1 Tax=Billgrantia montanilacus TaxID=2282305 RepID=A0A368TWJ9_9GAMM|nr:LysM domain-containing protein [Halomonas montanilacus]RCV89155.1 LysM domain-containing protein [Halomonas montanilacus]
MKNPIQAMYEAGIVEATDFPADSRYHGVPTRYFTAPDGRQLPYLTRRFVPAPERFATMGYRMVAESERLDQIAAETIGNAVAFWMHCDANRAIWAEELEVPGHELRLTLPEGVPTAEEGS